MTSRGTNGNAGITSAAALGGGVPVCDWKPVPKRKGSAQNIPIIVELYTNPLSRNWPLADNRRTQLTNSAPNLAISSIGFAGTASAAVVRPGPDFDPKLLYKVTLYNAADYSSWMLALTFGAYPDLHRYGFGDLTHSVLFEQGIPGEVPLENEYYDVSSYYTKL